MVWNELPHARFRHKYGTWDFILIKKTADGRNTRNFSHIVKSICVNEKVFVQKRNMFFMAQLKSPLVPFIESPIHTNLYLIIHEYCVQHSILLCSQLTLTVQSLPQAQPTSPRHLPIRAWPRHNWRVIGSRIHRRDNRIYRPDLCFARLFFYNDSFDMMRPKMPLVNTRIYVDTSSFTV